MKDNIEDILQRAEEDGSMDELIEKYEKLELDNAELKRKNQRLQIENSNSRAKQYKKTSDKLRDENRKLNNIVEKLKSNHNTEYSHLSREDIGVFSRMLNDFDNMATNQKITYPEREHPVFSRFNELANEYPNREYIVTSINDEINKQIGLVDFEIKMQKKNIELLNKVEEIKKEHPDDWEDEIDDKMAYLYRITTIEDITDKINILQSNKLEIKKWRGLKNNIETKPLSTTTKIKNNLYYDIMNEFTRIFELCSNVGNIHEYKAYIPVDSFQKSDLHSALARELEKQVGLCEEPYTHNFFYSNGEGRLVPYELNRQFLQYVHKNTTFVVFGKNNRYKKGDIINSNILFDEIPLYCDKIQYRNPNLVGFNNCFYNIEQNEIVQLNPKVPILPLKNTQTELYLDKNIEKNPMQDIFERCFTKDDRKILLAYIGCALYDKGYTQRQESLFIMGKGGTGKTTLTKAICSIFYSVGNQLVTKLTDKNQFGFSIFADNDVIVIDEIQSAPHEFGDKIKNISSSDALPVEKKHFDTINIPAENVPRVFFIGNNFSKKLYEASDSAGINRRILIVIPTQPIQDLGYNWKDLISNSSKQWLVQQATKEYIKQGLHKASIPIGISSDDPNKPRKEISDIEKQQRMELCTYPERFFIKKHFEVVYLDDTTIDNEERISYNDMFDFISKCINEKMVESVYKKTSSNMFISEVKKALKLDDYTTKTVKGNIFFVGIVPKTEEAINFLEEAKNEQN